MKVIKTYLINCPDTSEAQIYCIKQESDEDLTGFMEKIFLRCPSLRSISYVPDIYWYDLENDKIKVTCNDDLRFFLEESEISKLTIDYDCSVQEVSRKRHLADDENSEASKKIRRKLQQIDLSSDSSMDTDELLAEKELEVINNINVTSTNSNEENQPVASTSRMSENDALKPKIISVEVIKSADEVDKNETSIDNAPQEVTSQESFVENNNRIVISDSSDDEQEEIPRSRRYSDGHYSSSYSFAGIHNERTRASFDDNFRSYHQYRQQYRQQFRNQHAENIARMYQNTRTIRDNIMRNAEAIRNNAMQNIRTSANLYPQILSTFQSHFRPLFQSPNMNSQPFFRRH